MSLFISHCVYERIKRYVDICIFTFYILMLIYTDFRICPFLMEISGAYVRDGLDRKLKQIR